MVTHRSPTSKVLTAFIKLYRFCISPLIPANCRYIPSCSQYAVQAIEEHGSIHGSLLAFKRICRCHPWGDHGYDPVPPYQENNK